MKKKITVPTMLGLFLLLIGVSAGIYLINSRNVFKLSANIEAQPKSVRITNVSSDSLTVSWVTDVPSVGFVKWGLSENQIENNAPEESATEAYVHLVNIKGLSPNSTIYMKINSDNENYDNNGIYWSETTKSSASLPSSSLLSYGSVLQADGVRPAKALVHLTINGVVLSNITSDEGSFVIPISNFVENISDNTIIEITANAGEIGSAQAVIYPLAVQAIPTMLLGKTYDFRSLTASEVNEVPRSESVVPEGVSLSSRFEVQRSETPAQENLTIESIDEGEVINTEDPEFFGSGPKNTEIEILVESDPQEGSVTTNANGDWNWNPPQDLTPGEHKITVKWRDASGILRTLTRTFVVSAAEGPAFEASNSGTLRTPTPSPSPSPVPTATAVAVASITPMATTISTPETGSLTPTLGLFIMGIGVLISSIFVWNKSNA